MNYRESLVEFLSKESIYVEESQIDGLCKLAEDMKQGDGWFEDQIVKDLHQILSLVAKDKKFWNDLGYDGDGCTAEEIIGYMLKILAERGSKLACTGKMEDHRKP